MLKTFQLTQTVFTGFLDLVRLDWISWLISSQRSSHASREQIEASTTIMEQRREEAEKLRDWWENKGSGQIHWAEINRSELSRVAASNFGIAINDSSVWPTRQYANNSPNAQRRFITSLSSPS